jgi:hypothetical protein
MAEEFGKMKCKTINIVRNKVLITLFTLQISKTQYSGQNTIQHNENMTYQKKYYRTNWEIYSIQN